MQVTTNAEQMVEKAKFNKFHGMLLFWGALLMLFDGYDLVVYGAVVPTLMEEWGISAVQAGMYGSYALFGMMFGALIFGTLADKLGRKKIIMICVFIFSLFMLLAALAPTPEIFGLFRFITGLGLGGMMPNVIGLISEYSPEGTRSRMIATIMAGYSIGGVAAALLSMLLISNFGWESVFFFGALPILFLPFLAKSLPDSVGSLVAKNDYKGIQKILVKVNPTYTPSENENFILNKPKQDSSPVKNLFTEKRGFLTVMIWLTYFMSLLMIYGLNTWLPKFMTEAGFPLGSSLSFLLALNVGATVGADSNGMVSRSLGSWQSAYSVLCNRHDFNNKLRICNKYGSIVCNGSNCWSCNGWNTKLDTLLYFPILPDHDAFNSVRVGTSRWTYWRNTRTNDWRYFTRIKFNITV